MLDFPAIRIYKVELHAAELCALASVGRPMETMLRGVTNARIAHTKGAMRKYFQLHIGHPTVDFGNLGGRKLTGKHGTFEACRLQPCHLLGRSVIGLCGSMQCR